MTQPSIYSKADYKVILRSAVFFAGQICATLVMGPVMAAMGHFNFSFEQRYTMANRWVRFSLWLLKHVCRLEYEVKGLENIPERNGLVLCKHQSAFETIALQAIFPPVVFILKQELLKIPVWGWAMASQEPIAIDRGAKSQALKQVLREGEDRIARGRWVVLFPEGTRVRPGENGSYSGSGGLLAQRVGCPVVPVAHNAGEYWTKNGFLKFPGVIRVRIGPALDGGVLSGSEINRLAESWIETEMLAISGEGPYGRLALVEG